MWRLIRSALPLVAAFLLGSVLTVFASAGPADCDWDFRADTTVTSVGSGGAKTPEEAMAAVAQLNSNIKVPPGATEVGDGADRAVEIGTDADGGIGFNIYIEGVHRIVAYVLPLEDGTYQLDHFSTCLGV
jgi:hypothetical protein